MSKKIKVFGGVYDGRKRLIVGATTKKRAYELIHKVTAVGSYPTWCKYTSESGHPESVAICLENPETVFWMKNGHTINQTFVKIEPRNGK